MEKVEEIASYICSRYESQWGKRIDEMKLHKLLYFCQRESLIQLGIPLFPEQFEAWKYGPVLITIRQLYQQDKLHSPLADKAIRCLKAVFDKVFEIYAPKDSWSLSTLTHGECSWQKARAQMNGGSNGRALLSIDDIREDADRIRIRRFLLERTDILQKIR